jgi:hypothetical protein
MPEKGSENKTGFCRIGPVQEMRIRIIKISKSCMSTLWVWLKVISREGNNLFESIIMARRRTPQKLNL